ncbi:MAG: serine/threonine-protein phosphatase, partial [Gammaproteobacteria bacterium]|nr:serine/threonine-protein phosphatase [Gammaproteobacteria bacterium]NIR93294.1 serine/threonine-protein phosphatase [Gammaproteobacteria bacterium]NIW39869.1 SpoIIE family protein phosphatase [candidate division Zixibacteria bacterium]NIX54711.1 SpoIIE family protein phosphatase [candidate division Zixibacteria bacterium]
YAVLDTASRTMTYINAGHNPPLLFRGNEIIRLRTGGVPVGLFNDAAYNQETLQILPGDMLVIYSDGFSEAPNADWEQFGEDQIIKVVRQHFNQKPMEIIDELEQSVTKFISTQINYSDDRTIVILKSVV